MPELTLATMPVQNRPRARKIGSAHHCQRPWPRRSRRSTVSSVSEIDISDNSKLSSLMLFRNSIGTGLRSQSNSTLGTVTAPSTSGAMRGLGAQVVLRRRGISRLLGWRFRNETPAFRPGLRSLVRGLGLQAEVLGALLLQARVVPVLRVDTGR